MLLKGRLLKEGQLQVTKDLLSLVLDILLCALIVLIIYLGLTHERLAAV